MYTYIKIKSFCSEHVGTFYNLKLKFMKFNWRNFKHFEPSYKALTTTITSITYLLYLSDWLKIIKATYKYNNLFFEYSKQILLYS